MFDPGKLEERGQEAEAAATRISGEGVRFLQMEMPDLNGTLRGKIVGLRKGLSPGGTGMSTLTVSFRSHDEVSLTSFSNYENSFPKMVAVPDVSTLVRWPWRPDMGAILCDFYMEDGTPCPMDARLILKRVVDEYRKLDLEPRAAVEYEFYIYHDDDELLRENRYRELKTFGRGWDCYSISRFPSFESLATEFLSRMEGAGVKVEAFHTELGHGMFEFAVEHESPVKAADDAVRAKLYLKQLCAERGLVATFMPAIHIGTGDSCCGAHHHLSLWRDGKNISWDRETKTLSPVTRWFAAGMMETMPDFHLVFRPWVNSHRRLNSLLWSPENASWGLDSHTAAIRVIHGSIPEKHTRLEHRAPGSDVNPYLCLAVMLLGGLHGIRHHLDPGGYAEGDPLKYERFKMLSRTYPESIERFRSSEMVRESLGNAFVEHYASVKNDEWSDFTKWAAECGIELPTEQVTDWEFRRYFVWV